MNPYLDETVIREAREWAEDCAYLPEQARFVGWEEVRPGCPYAFFGDGPRVVAVPLERVRKRDDSVIFELGNGDIADSTIALDDYRLTHGGITFQAVTRRCHELVQEE